MFDFLAIYMVKGTLLYSDVCLYSDICCSCCSCLLLHPLLLMSSVTPLVAHVFCYTPCCSCLLLHPLLLMSSVTPLVARLLLHPVLLMSSVTPLVAHVYCYTPCCSCLLLHPLLLMSCYTPCCSCLLLHPLFMLFPITNILFKNIIFKSFILLIIAALCVFCEPAIRMTGLHKAQTWQACTADKHLSHSTCSKVIMTNDKEKQRDTDRQTDTSRHTDKHTYTSISVSGTSIGKETHAKFSSSLST